MEISGKEKGYQYYSADKVFRSTDSQSIVTTAENCREHLSWLFQSSMPFKHSETIEKEDLILLDVNERVGFSPSLMESLDFSPVTAEKKSNG